MGVSSPAVVAVDEVDDAGADQEGGVVVAGFAVDGTVVGGAEPDEIGEISGSALLPVLEVVGVDPGGGGVAVREPASVVAYDHGVTQVG